MHLTATQAPLCVDLDGTLIRSDLSAESLLNAVKRAPLTSLFLPFWLLRGRHYLKEQLAARANVDVTVLPYNQDVVNLVKEARQEGRETVLITGSNRKYAHQVADHLQLFSRILSSDQECNLVGHQKVARLNKEWGPGNYEYVSNSPVDLPVWRAAKAIVTVNASPSVVRACAAMGKPHRDIPVARQPIRHFLRAMRLHQWAKNLLLYVPLLTAHKVFDPVAVGTAVLAFMCFGLCASATYIVNDLLDLDADRHHTKKRSRPFASGALNVQAGVLGSVLLLLTGLGIASFLPTAFFLSMITYAIVTLLYSMRLKRIASLDVVTLAALYTLRVVAGAFAVGVALSFWLLAFSMFIFLCLALVKRVAELIELSTATKSIIDLSVKARGREYTTEDIPILQNLGSSSGYMAVLVLALYINAPEVSLLYKAPAFLWLVVPLLLLWITRIWVVTTRGYMDQDPILFAIKDPETWLCAFITAIVLACATYIEI